MTYANYINGDANVVSGANTNTYNNYANAYYNAGYAPSYGYYGAMTYANYNNWTRRTPAAYTITATSGKFTDGQIVYSANMKADIAKLRTDLVKISQEKVAKNTTYNDNRDVIYYEPAFTENADAKFNQYEKPTKTQIQEMTDKVKQLWQSIQGAAGTGWPDLTNTNPNMLDTDYKTLVTKTQDLANVAQPRTSGYLNCAHWTNAAGIGYTGPHGAGGDPTGYAGSNTYSGGNR